ncbi:hypothetical protein ACSBOX_11795 [Arthrobacter sp. KN11-1C]|uniref:hypothetical protein n=1 Tax=Arthrobacter sp. KN11-1C TaxID=3445774 RepID=UPI003FA1092A
MTDIWVPIVAAAIGGVMGIAASLIVYILEKRRNERAARHEAKRVAVSRMLDVLDEAIKVQVLPPLIRRWKNPDAALLLALSRLLLDLQKEDIPVALWSAGQVQRMVFETARKEYLFRATKLQSRLLSWYRGDEHVHWFSDALKNEPFVENWRPSPAVRVKAGLRDASANLGFLAAAVLAYAVTKENVLPAVSRLVQYASEGTTK